MNRYFFECFVEQIYHFEALENDVWKKLKQYNNNVVFDLLSVEEDKSGTYKNQVLVKFENKKLGVLSINSSLIIQ